MRWRSERSESAPVFRGSRLGRALRFSSRESGVILRSITRTRRRKRTEPATLRTLRCGRSPCWLCRTISARRSKRAETRLRRSTTRRFTPAPRTVCRTITSSRVARRIERTEAPTILVLRRSRLRHRAAVADAVHLASRDSSTGSLHSAACCKIAIRSSTCRNRSHVILRHALPQT